MSDASGAAASRKGERSSSIAAVRAPHPTKTRASHGLAERRIKRVRGSIEGAAGKTET
jgi:hypothetical protein